MFTVSEETKHRVRAWVCTAIVDGWHREAAYKHESVDRACHLTRDGYTVSALMREPIENNKFAQSTVYTLNAWCPRGLSLQIPHPYSFEQLVKNTRLCGKCGQEDVDTFRVAFANRVCKVCLPLEKQRLETPGWCD